MTRPLLLDLFCGAGGAAMGYHRAGFDVIGVDINPQPHYPFAFEQGDALDYLREEIRLPARKVDAVHASPPCQAYTQAALSQRNSGKVYPDLLAPTRDLLAVLGRPWVIENVPGAPMRADILICGCRVGLELRRKRLFETSWQERNVRPACVHTGTVVSVVGHGTPSWVRAKLGFNPTIAHYRAAMGIDWMNRGELSQAIPPAYTELVGALLLAHLERQRCAA